jgi:hypothetical protein
MLDSIYRIAVFGIVGWQHRAMIAPGPIGQNRHVDTGSRSDPASQINTEV